MLDVTRAYGLSFMFPEADAIVGAALRYYGEFARPELDYIVACLKGFGAGGFLDVGANVGAMALPAAAALRDRPVVAIEAHRGLAGVLVANALNNQLYNVEVINAAAGPEAGLARFPRPTLAAKINFGRLGLHMTDERYPTEAVRLCTLDEVAPADTRLVKIDVEGAELDVLSGAKGLIEARRAVWVVEAHADKETARAPMRLMLDAGYRLFWFFAPFVTAKRSKSGPKVERINGDMNFVAVPPDVDPLWDMPEIADPDEPRPRHATDYKYLWDYGFSPARPKD